MVRTKTVYRVLKTLTSRHENFRVSYGEKYYFPYALITLPRDTKEKDAQCHAAQLL